MSAETTTDNIDLPSPNMKWYKGLCLTEVLHSFRTSRAGKRIHKPLQISIFVTRFSFAHGLKVCQQTHKIGGVGTVSVGKVLTGTLTVKQEVVLHPEKIKGEVKSIEIGHNNITTAFPGDLIGFNIRNVRATEAKAGFFFTSVKYSPPLAISFTAKVMFITIANEVKKGYDFSLCRSCR